MLDVKGDWAEERPGVRPGGWAFQYNNAHYPDLDDTAVVVMALDRARGLKQHTPEADIAIARGREWVEGLQSRNGGWGAFDADNAYYYLNNIPFADHGALLDPPTADVSARCIGMLAQLGEPLDSPRMKAALAYMAGVQEKDGSWFGRWGVNYIYGTWSALAGLNAAGLDSKDPMIRRAADWLIAIQNEDGGWGEDCDSYKLRLQRLRARAVDGVADGLGASRADGSRRSRSSVRGARHSLSAAHPERRRIVAARALHGRRIPARVLPALSRLSEILPALGRCALPQSQSGQCAPRCLRVVMLLAVTGLRREARIVESDDMTTISSGGNQPSLTQQIAIALRGTARGVVSFGIAGALAPALMPGDCVVASHIIDGSEIIACDAKWLKAIVSWLPDAHVAAIAGSRTILADVDAKAALYRRTGAAAVDMEIAHCRPRRARPWPAFRRRADDFGRCGPYAAAGGAGRTEARWTDRFSGSGALAPRAAGADPGLIRTARESERAFAALFRCRSLLGPGLAFPYLG